MGHNGLFDISSVERTAKTNINVISRSLHVYILK